MSAQEITSSTNTNLGAAPDGLRWQIRLLGGLQARCGSRDIHHFPSRAVALLLARLASAPERVQPREELIDLLWPGVDLGVGRNRLRQVLSTLKRLLEGDAAGASPVLQADRMNVRVVAGALDSDVQQLERHWRQGDIAAAQALARGEFLPGHYDQWVLDERSRLAALCERIEQNWVPGVARRDLMPLAVMPQSVTPHAEVYRSPPPHPSRRPRPPA